METLESKVVNQESMIISNIEFDKFKKSLFIQNSDENQSN